MTFIKVEKYNNIVRELRSKEIKWNSEKEILKQEIEILNLKLDDSVKREKSIKNSYNLLINSLNDRDTLHKYKEIEDISQDSTFKNLNLSSVENIGINEYYHKIVNYDNDLIIVNDLKEENHFLRNKINLLENNSEDSKTFENFINKKKNEEKIDKIEIFKKLKNYFLKNSLENIKYIKKFNDFKNFSSIINKDLTNKIYLNFEKNKIFLTENIKNILQKNNKYDLQNYSDNFDLILINNNKIQINHNVYEINDEFLFYSLFSNYNKNNNTLIESNKFITLFDKSSNNKRETFKKKTINNDISFENHFKNNNLDKRETLKNNDSYIEIDNTKKYNIINNKENIIVKQTKNINFNNNKNNLKTDKTLKNKNNKIIQEKFNNIKYNIKDNINLDFYGYNNINNSLRRSKSIGSINKEKLYMSKCKDIIIKESIQLKQNKNIINFNEILKNKKKSICNNFKININ